MTVLAEASDGGFAASPPTARQEWRASAGVVAGAAIGLGTGFSVWAYVASLFVLPLGDAFGWTRGQVAGAAATGLVGAALAPFVGRLADRVGIRPVVLISTAVLGAMYLALSFMPPSIGAFYLLMTLLGVAGLGTIGITYTRAVASWFVASRGLALGVALLGVSVSAMLLPPLLSSAMTEFGWRGGYWLLSGSALLVGLPAAYLLVRERPAATAAQREPLPWRVIVGSPVFWILVVAIIAVNIPGAGILGQLQPMLVDVGLSRSTAASMLSVYAAAIFVGRLGFGFLLDRMSPPVIAAIPFGTPIIGAILLMTVEISLPVAILVALLLGLSAGAEMDVVGFMVARYFGLRHYSTLFGAMMTALVIASAAGNILYGQNYDATGSYGFALALSIGGYGLGAVLMLLLLKRRPVLVD